MTRALKVPVHVDAIAIPAGGAPAGAPWAGSTTDDLFSTAAPLEPGVHLQWALPDALTRGEIAEDGDVRFPTVPDRWLVVRFNTPNRATRRSYRAWIVEAQSGGKPIPLDTWLGGRPPASAPRLTAVGFQRGDDDIEPIDGVKGPTVAAYYRDCRGRFGFHDPLDTGSETALSGSPGRRPPSAGPLSYLVVGWYSVPARDPLHALSTWSQRQEWLAEAGWKADSLGSFVPTWTLADLGDIGDIEFPTRRERLFDPDDFVAPGLAGLLENVDRYTADTSAAPDRLYLHGQVVDVSWGGVGGQHFAPNVPLRPDDPLAETPKITLGSSLSEALAQVVGRGDLGIFVEAVQHGLTGQLGTTEGIERLPHLLHERSFASQPSAPDVRYVVELHDPKTTFAEDADPDDEDAGPRLDIPGRLKGMRDVPRTIRELEVRDYRGARTRPAVAVGSAGRPLGAGPRTTSRLTVGSRPSAASRPTLNRAAAGRTSGLTRLSSGLRIDAARRAVLGTTDRSFTGPVAPDGLRVDHIADLVTLADAGMASGVFVGRPLAETVLAGGPFGGARAWLRRVEIPRPRWWKPNAPALLVHSPKRSYRHGFDGRFDEDGLLMTRAEGQGVTSMLPTKGVPSAGRVTADRLFFEREGLAKLPPAARELVREAVLLDPTNAGIMGRVAAHASARTADEDAFVRAFEVETTYWWGARSEVSETAAIGELSGYAGLLPSVLALKPWSPGWAPVLLEVEVEYIPTTGALKSEWPLGGVEHEPVSMPPDLATTPSRHTFRLLPTAAAVLSLADSIATLAKDGKRIGAVSQQRQRALRQLARQVENLDLLTCSLAGLDDLLRSEGVDVRAGALRVVRARLIDAFGQVVPIEEADAANPEEEVDLGGGERAVLLTPRVPQWARLMFRLMEAGDGESEASSGKTSVCGWLVPDHIEHAVEVFDGEGRALGQLRHRTHDSLEVVWDPAPGTEPPAGRQAWSTIHDPRLAGLVQGILDHNLRLPPEGDPSRPTESALSALVRVIDTVQGTVDRVGETQEYLATILGRPVAVARARVTYEVKDPESGPKPQPSGLELRLGSLAQLDDGLLGYYVDGDYGTVHPPDPIVAQSARPSGPRRGLMSAGRDTTAVPIDSPYVNVDPTVDLQPDVPRELTLLMDPRAGVHATMGVLPRKRISLDRDQVDAALAALAPTFSAGPVLIDPAANALPIPALEGFQWSWTRREGPPGDAAGWSETPLAPASGAAVVPDRTVPAHEGWLRLRSEE